MIWMELAHVTRWFGDYWQTGILPIEALYTMTKNNIPEGTRFGLLTVLKLTDRKSGGNRYFLTHCDCGNIIEVQGSHLLHSRVTSCGCVRLPRPVTADKTTRRIRQAWRHMINRCTDAACKDYVNYGARGISVCIEWQEDFNAFKEWALANGYSDDLSLDRVNNDGHYTPDNCRWATIEQQNRNTRRVRRVSAMGETKTLAEWADDPRCLVSYFTLRQRVVYLGWGIEAALSTGKYERPQSAAA